MDCSEEAIQQPPKKSVQAVAEQLPLATHGAICRGRGAEHPWKEEDFRCRTSHLRAVELGGGSPAGGEDFESSRGFSPAE